MLPQIVVQLYTNSLHAKLPMVGFFEGWAAPPPPGGLQKILAESYCAFVAIDGETQRIVGFVNCISDGVLSCFVPLLEVLPEYRRQGIARELVTRVLEHVKQFYMVDLICDNELVKFYEQFGFQTSNAMVRRNYDWQQALRNVPVAEAQKH